jgi:hypothetical protein
MRSASLGKKSVGGAGLGGVAGYGVSTGKTEVGPISVGGTPQKPKLGSSIHAKNLPPV